MRPYETMNDRYAPIADYAAVGDCHGAALVSRTGAVDWCCLGRFDADPIFCRLLDTDNGGFFVIRPAGEHGVERAYSGETNILRTVFSTSTGKAAVTDFMPVGRRPGASTHDYVSLNAPHWLARVVEGLEGTVSLDVRYRPSVDFARQPARLHLQEGGIACEHGPVLYSDAAFELDGDQAFASLEVSAGDARRFVVAREASQRGAVLERLPELLDVTRAFWEEWIDYCRYRGRHRDAVVRSALALKLMTHAPTGAVVAALTTSLPEEIGGVRNWDYRYCWLRDGAFTLYALASIGYGGEARRFAQYLREACARSWPHVHIMYGVGLETELREHELDHLEGYRGSAPVRVGNAAYEQRQLDVHGEILDWALLHHELGGRMNAQGREMLRSLVDTVKRHWEEPDQGLWEMRGPPRHHVHGKLMCWVAVDRALRLFGRDGELEDLRDRIASQICTRGIDPAGGHLRGRYDEAGLDAALLVAPVLGFPVERDVLERTVEAVRRELGEGDFLRRYEDADGISGDEGAFLICSFWLVDALLLLDRAEEARALFERLLRHTNDVGLYSEEIDPNDGTFLGNFPQAFTHLALIGSAALLVLHDRCGAEGLAGTHADRVRRRVDAVFGWRAILAAARHSGRIGRLFSSRRSILPPELAD